MVKIYKKLVRDRIPEIIKNNGGRPKVKKLSTAAFKKALVLKLMEEVSEFRETPNEEEFADIMEVLDSILVAFRLNKKRIRSVKRQKADTNGRFDRRLFLNSVKT